MTRNRVALLPFVLLAQLHCLTGVNAAFTKTLDDLILLETEHGSKCTPGHDILKEECAAAGALVGGVLRNNYVQVGNWPNTPPGCFIQTADKAIHFGENPGGINDSRFQSICVSDAVEAILLEAGQGIKCTGGKDFSKDECIAAATSLGGTLRNGQFKVGEWSHTPYGCFLEGEDKAIHFGTNIDGVNVGYSQPVCKTCLDKARLLPAPWHGVKCKAAHDFPKDGCVDAALSVGGKLRHGALTVGSYPQSPPGCFLQPSDNAIHYNTNVNGINNGGFQPVCMVGDLQIRLVHASPGTRCKQELKIPEEDCVEAAQTVGGKLRNGGLITGDWSFTPSGCFVQDGDRTIHFGRNPDGVNIGMFRPVCIKDEVEQAHLIPHLIKGTKCIPGHDFSSDDCFSAATSVGGRLRNQMVISGHWPNTPYGCFLEAKDKAVHFSTNPDGVNNGYFQPVCKPGEIEANLHEAGQGGKCTDEHDFSKEECVAAGTAVGGTLRGDTLLVGEWSNSPFGCFIDPSDNAIHYGTDPNGINLGGYRSICKSVAHEAALLPAHYGNRCQLEHDFSLEDCMVAAMSVGGTLRGGKVKVGSWPHAPPGCFVEATDKAIHFNMIDGVNIGAFQSVCIYA